MLQIHFRRGHHKITSPSRSYDHVSIYIYTYANIVYAILCIHKHTQKWIWILLIPNKSFKISAIRLHKIKISLPDLSRPPAHAYVHTYTYVLPARGLQTKVVCNHFCARTSQSLFNNQCCAHLGIAKAIIIAVGSANE